jgi:S-disulfanyl-L-cysteine oxidoreductase SoxD
MRHLPLACAVTLASALFAAGCGSDDSENSDKDTASAPQTFEEQVTLGQTLFGQKCAHCHGDSGQGTTMAPPLVGLDDGALPLDPPPGAKVRTTQFVTVMDVANFAVKYMPADAPGSLSTEQYFSVLAFDLHANGIDLDQKLDAALAATLTIPR